MMRSHSATTKTLLQRRWIISPTEECNGFAPHTHLTEQKTKRRLYCKSPALFFYCETPRRFFAEGGSAAAVMAKGAVEESPEAMSFVSSPLFMAILAAAVIGISVGSVFLSAKRYCRNN